MQPLRILLLPFLCERNRLKRFVCINISGKTHIPEKLKRFP